MLNPIAQSEVHYQRFVIERSRSSRFWIVLAALLVIPSLLASVYYSVLALAMPFVPSIVTQTRDSLQSVGSITGNLLVVLLVVMTIAMYSVVTLVSLGLASNSISREKSGKTWDNLRLTDIGARRIVWGKWWATLRAMLGDHIMVGVVRVGLQAWVVLLAVALDYTTPTGGLIIFVSLLFFTLWYTALDTGLTAAFGILSALPNASVAFLAGIGVLVGRGVCTVVALAWMLATLYVMLTLDVGLGWGMTLLGSGVYMGVIALVLYMAQDVVG
jgi:ABC-type transport system involved in multi-copper enzyme maturation permease subunit